MLPFKDISYAQGQWNMDTDSDPIVAMKASGFYTVSHQSYLDSQLVRNYADAIRLGKVPIMYHFAGGADPVVEATYFVSAASPLAKGDVYALDWEIEHDNPVGWVLAFVTHVYNLTGVWPFVYIDIDRLNRFDWTPVFNKCPLWCAAPSFGWDATLPVKYVVSAQQGPIINGVDTDMWFGDLEGIKKCSYGYQVPAPNPVPVAPTPAPEPAPAPAPSPPPVAPPQPPEPQPTPSSPPPAEVPPAPSPPPTVITPAQSWVAKLIAFLKSLFGIKE